MEEEKSYDWDLFVIGAGSGGLSAAKNAATLGKRVAICDFVKPSPQGTTWGIGGTCVNVGCIPKKLMHFAALTGELRHDQDEAGWTVDASLPHNWEKMVTNVNNYIRGLNWGYKKELLAKGVKVYPRLGSVIDAHTVKLVNKKGVEATATAERILIAVGGRPFYVDVPGAKEHCISSDDIFWLKKAPGKTLLIGAGYIAMECGGFLRGMGHEVAIMVRSKPLRAFDSDMASRIIKQMEDHGVRFLMKSSPSRFEKLENGQVKAFWNTTNEDGTTVEVSEEFDTVVMAVGRYPDTQALGLENAGVELLKGRVKVDDFYQTNVPSIYAIGDVIVNSPELTPVAIREGQIMTNKLYGSGAEPLNYDLIATAVFTPLEYGSIGLSEEAAREKYGDSNIEVYHTSFKPLEWNFLKSHQDNLCYTKMVVDESQNDKVIGLHYAGPNAGEVIQGYAVAVTAGLTRKAFIDTIGIHPTTSEEIVTLNIKKSEQAEVIKSGC